MKKHISIVLLAVSIFCTPFTTLSAQQVLPQFGYLSYSAVLLQMPEYTQASQQYEELRGKYEAEATRAEEEFQRKFAEFMQGQSEFPASIMQKRQAELQELMERSISFRQESQRLLTEAETALKQPAVDHLNAAIQAVGADKGLMFILNTDGNACPFVHPQAGVDVTTAVLEKLAGTPIVLP